MVNNAAELFGLYVYDQLYKLKFIELTLYLLLRILLRRLKLEYRPIIAHAFLFVFIVQAWQVEMHAYLHWHVSVTAVAYNFRQYEVAYTILQQLIDCIHVYDSVYS